MFGEGHDESIVRAGIDEALACRDLLEPAPRQPSAVARTAARARGVLRAVERRLMLARSDRGAAPPQPSLGDRDATGRLAGR